MLITLKNPYRCFPVGLYSNPKLAYQELSDLVALREQVEQSAVALHQEWAGLIAQTEQLAELQSIWQERATTVEHEARQLRRNLDAMSSSQHALQKQLDEERQAREELALQVGKLLQRSQQQKEKGRG
jgi:hypothetical protein